MRIQLVAHHAMLTVEYYLETIKSEVVYIHTI